MAVQPTSSYQVLSNQGPTLDDYLKNAIAYEQLYDVKEALNEETRNTIAGLMSMLDPNDPKSKDSYNILNNIKSNVDDAALHMSTYGLDSYTKQLVHDARVNASMNVPRITQAISDLAEIRKLIRNKSIENPQTLYNAGTEGGVPGLGVDDFLYNKQPMVYSLDLKELYKNGETLGNNLSTRIWQEWYEKNGIQANGMMQDIVRLVSQTGIRWSKRETLKRLFEDERYGETLRAAAEGLIDMTAYNHMDEEQQERAAATAIAGIYSGLRAAFGSQFVPLYSASAKAEAIKNHKDVIREYYSNDPDVNIANSEEQKWKDNNITRADEFLNEYIISDLEDVADEGMKEQLSKMTIQQLVSEKLRRRPEYYQHMAYITEFLNKKHWSTDSRHTSDMLFGDRFEQKIDAIAERFQKENSEWSADPDELSGQILDWMVGLGNKFSLQQRFTDNFQLNNNEQKLLYNKLLYTVLASNDYAGDNPLIFEGEKGEPRTDKKMLSSTIRDAIQKGNVTLDCRAVDICNGYVRFALTPQNKNDKGDEKSKQITHFFVKLAPSGGFLPREIQDLVTRDYNRVQELYLKYKDNNNRFVNNTHSLELSTTIWNILNNIILSSANARGYISGTDNNLPPVSYTVTTGESNNNNNNE